MEMPVSYLELFANGTTPLEWNTSVPTLTELRERLSGQQRRILNVLKDDLQKDLPEPYTTSTGLTMGKVEELLNFTLYHEGMHYSVIKMYKKLLR
jgi:hypothetical protein